MGTEENESKRTIDMGQARKMFSGIQDLIQDLNYVHSEKMLEIANQMAELKMFLFPDSFTTVNVTMGDLMSMMEKGYSNLQDVPSKPLRMERYEPSCLQANDKWTHPIKEEGRAD